VNMAEKGLNLFLGDEFGNGYSVTRREGKVAEEFGEGDPFRCLGKIVLPVAL